MAGRLGGMALGAVLIVLVGAGCSTSTRREVRASGPIYSAERVASCLASYGLNGLVSSPSEAGPPWNAVPDLTEMVGIPATGVVAPGVRIGKPEFTGVYLLFERTPDAAVKNRGAALHAYMSRMPLGIGYKVGLPPTHAAAESLESVHGNVIAIWFYPRRYYVARSARELAACFARDA